MRPRFSLRTFFVITTAVAVFCYYWLVMPSITARHFARAVADKDYATADEYFLDREDRCLDAWSKEHWAFQAQADLHAVTVPQLIQGRRNVRISVKYFAFDQNVSHTLEVAATPHGLKSPHARSESRVSVTIGKQSASIDINP